MLESEALQAALNRSLEADNKEPIDFASNPTVDDFVVKGITFDQIIDIINTMQVEKLEPV